jgi:hypothetical protein
MAYAVTNVGRNWLCVRLGATGGGTFSSAAFYVGWGNGSGQNAAATDTALFGELDTRVSAAASTAQTNGTGYADTLVVVGTMTAGAARTIDNAGVLDAASGGNLFLHASFPAISVQSGDQVSLTFRLVFP